MKKNEHALSWGMGKARTRLLYGAPDEVGCDAGQLAAPPLQPPARRQTQRPLSKARKVGQVLKEPLEVASVAAIYFQGSCAHVESLGLAVVSRFLSCCYVGRSGGCRGGVAVSERVPDGEIDEKAFLSHNTPTFHVQLRRKEVGPSELRDDLLAS